MIHFTWPAAWLLTLPLAVLFFYRPPAGKWLFILRVLLYVLLIAALSGPLIRHEDRAGTLAVLIDDSRSMPAGSASSASTFLRELEKTRPSDSRLAVIRFGRNAVVTRHPDSPGGDAATPKADIDPDTTNPAAALRSALRLLPENTPARIVLLTDGRWNLEHPAPLLAAATARGIPVDWRRPEAVSGNDPGILDLQAPFRAAPGEYYPLQLRVYSPDIRRGVCRIRRSGSSGQEVPLSLRPGINVFTWRDRTAVPGVVEYTLELQFEGRDDFSENNRARRLIEIAGRKPLLLLTDSTTGHFERLLRASGLPVVAHSPSPGEVTVERLSGYSGIILENVPASRIGPDGLTRIAELVKNGTIGLMMTGGRRSFAVGGYYRTPIADLLPVSLEQRQELHKTRSAVMIALDRSGSMSANIGGITKMSMANLAAVEVLRLLAPSDEFGLIAVDSSAHVVVPWGKVGDPRNAEQRILAIESMGGGIFTYTALHRATAELLRSNADKRHLILFADAQDAEEPGEFRSLLKRTSAAGITVSVVALGKESDCDAAFLQEVAQLGNGICYFSDRPDELPRIFTEDTFVMARSTFVDQPTRMRYTPAAQLLPSAEKFGDSTEFGGYNVCFARAGSDVILVSEDEFRAPVAAVGQAGLGRVSVLTAEVDGEYTGKFAQDPAAGHLLGALAAWMATPEQTGEDFLVTQTLSGGAHRIELFLDPERERDPFDTPPQITTVLLPENGPAEQRQDLMEYHSPDRLVLELPLQRTGVSLSTVNLPGHRPIPLAPAALPNSPEFRPVAMEVRAEEFFQLAAATGGQERLVPDGLWQALPRKTQDFPLAPLLSLLAIATLLLEVAERRFHWTQRVQLPAIRRHRQNISKIPAAAHDINAAVMPVPSRFDADPSARQSAKHPVQPASSSPPSHDEDNPLSAALKKAGKR